MWAHQLMQDLTAHSYLSSLALLTVQSSMGLTQPTWTCHTLLSLLRLVQQGTLSVWYWGSDWTPQLCTTTLCLQLVEISLWQCEGPSQHHSTVSICALAWKLLSFDSKETTELHALYTHFAVCNNVAQWNILNTVFERHSWTIVIFWAEWL